MALHIESAKLNKTAVLEYTARPRGRLGFTQGYVHLLRSVQSIPKKLRQPDTHTRLSVESTERYTRTQCLICFMDSRSDVDIARYKEVNRSRSTPAPRKRTRFAARPPPSVQSQQRSANGNGLPRLRSTPESAPTIFERLARAQRTAESKPRPDSRFVAGRRPLDSSLPSVRTSLSVAFFDNGYVRHDDAHSTGGADVPTRARRPYSGADARRFHTSLRLGVIPPDDFLPPPSQCHWQDGCLIASVYDLRGVNQETIAKAGANWRTHASHSRVLLRPDAFTHVSDVDACTQNLEERTSIAFESRLLVAQHPNLDLDPTPRPQDPQLTITQSPLRRRKRRRERADDVPMRPSASMSALLLIDASAKEQFRSDLRANEARHRTPAPTENQALAQLPEFIRYSGEATAQEVTPAYAASYAARAKQEAPKKLFESASERFSQTPQTASRPERVRLVRLLLPDRQSAHIIRQAKANGGAHTNQEQLLLVQKTVQNLNRPGRNVCIMEAVARPGRGCDVCLYRGIIGDKARDVTKLPKRSVAEASAFLDQYKRILEREGYICIHDGNPSKSAAVQAEVRRRALANASATGMHVTPQHAAAAMRGRGLTPQQRVATQTQVQAQAVLRRGYSERSGLLPQQYVGMGMMQAQRNAQLQQMAAAKHQQMAAASRMAMPVSPIRPGGVHNQMAMMPNPSAMAGHAQLMEQQQQQAAMRRVAAAAVGGSDTMAAANAIPPNLLKLDDQNTTTNSVGSGSRASRKQR